MSSRMVSCNENNHGLTFWNNYLSLLNNLTIEADNVNSDASCTVQYSTVGSWTVFLFVQPESYFLDFFWQNILWAPIQCSRSYCVAAAYLAEADSSLTVMGGSHMRAPD